MGPPVDFLVVHAYLVHKRKYKTLGGHQPNRWPSNRSAVIQPPKVYCSRRQAVRVSPDPIHVGVPLDNLHRLHPDGNTRAHEHMT